jgi:RHS repeat-associated protein
MVRARIWSSDPDDGGIILHEEQYKYDALDRRIQILVDSDGAGPGQPEVTKIIYNGDNAWADFNAAGERIAHYMFGNRIDHNIAMYRPDQGVSWYLTSKLGTVRDIINAAGQVVNHYEYSSFGIPVFQLDPWFANRYLFTGRESTFDSGAYYYRARFYDSRRGRFLSLDPSCFEAGDINLFRSVNNSALNATDPTGETVFSERNLILVLVVLAVANALKHFSNVSIAPEDCMWLYRCNNGPDATPSLFDKIVYRAFANECTRSRNEAKRYEPGEQAYCRARRPGRW